MTTTSLPAEVMTTETTTCRECGTDIEYEPIPADSSFAGRFSPSLCDECGETRRHADEAEQRLVMIAERNVPRRYARSTFDNFICGTPTQERALDAMRCDASSGVYLIGRAGCGKTHLAAAAVLSGPYGSLFVATTDMLDDIRAGFDGDGQGLMARARTAPLLALDDLGTESVTDWVRDRLYTLLNERWNRCLPLIVTTNCTPKVIAERIGDGAASRIAGLCARRIEIKGADMRRQTTS